MSTRCDRHGLVTGPNGRCVLCKRDSERSAHATPQPRAAPPVRAVLLLVVLFTCIGAAVWVLGGEPWKPFVPEALAGNWRAPAVAHVAVSERQPITALAQQRLRGKLESEEDYDVKNESYELYVPPTDRDSKRARGLLIWVSASGSGRPPQHWFPVFDKHGLIWAGPNKVGNEREVTTRVGLAVDVAHAVMKKFAVEPGRVLVAGMSGGAKSALRALLMYPDVFSGGVFVCGADYFRDVPSIGGRRWPARFGRPHDLETAKLRPFTLITGSNDFNLQHVSDVAAAMASDGFAVSKHVVSGLGHDLPSAAEFDQVLTQLEQRLRQQ